MFLSYPRAERTHDAWHAVAVFTVAAAISTLSVAAAVGNILLLNAMAVARDAGVR